MTDEMITEEDFDEIDREALNRALQMSLDGADRDHAQQVREELSELGWWEATTTAVYHHQCKTLGLKPWESPPCHCNDDDSKERKERDHAAFQLLKRMLAHNVSKWEPDPVAAINATRSK
jgi:hypothetical protein